MKNEKCLIDAAKFENIIRASGLSVTVQKGFVKVSAAKGINVYVAKQKRVGRVDLSGFRVELPAVADLGDDGKFGSVEQELDFTCPEEEVLETFALVLEHMKTLPERQVVRKSRKGNDSGAVGWSFFDTGTSSSVTSSSPPSSSDSSRPLARTEEQLEKQLEA